MLTVACGGDTTHQTHQQRDVRKSWKNIQKKSAQIAAKFIKYQLFVYFIGSGFRCLFTLLIQASAVCLLHLFQVQLFVYFISNSAVCLQPCYQTQLFVYILFRCEFQLFLCYVWIFPPKINNQYLFWRENSNDLFITIYLPKMKIGRR